MGDTAQAAEPVAGVVVEVVAVLPVVTALGLVGDSPPHATATEAAPTAPNTPKA